MGDGRLSAEHREGYYRVVNVYTGAMKCTKRTRIPRGRPTVASGSNRDKSHLPSDASRDTEVIMAVVALRLYN